MYWIGKGSLLIGGKVVSSGKRVPKKLRGKITDPELKKFLSDVDPNAPKKVEAQKPVAKKDEKKKPKKGS
jgi:hypothetical protein